LRAALILAARQILSGANGSTHAANPDRPTNAHGTTHDGGAASGHAASAINAPRTNDGVRFARLEGKRRGEGHNAEAGEQQLFHWLNS
jgi:hypothetical protein